MKRLVLVPALLFLGFAGAAFALAKLHLAKPGVPKTVAGAPVELGDPYRGETVYQQTCASCHGQNAEGGVGPALRDNPISLAAAKAVLDAGRGAMPAGLVRGAPQRDLLAYLETILARPEPPS